VGATDDHDRAALGPPSSRAGIRPPGELGGGRRRRIELRHGNYCVDATVTTPRPDGTRAGRAEPGVDGVLAASKALVGVAARSLAALGDDELTLPQFRALLLVVEGRASGPGDLATLLEVHPSNATRIVDRLVAKGLLDRAVPEDDRRSVALAPTSSGRAAVSRVLTARRRVLEEILGRMPDDEATVVGVSLARFADTAGEAAGEPADDAWRLGWGS
jgi:DNA-binding MarR family transcriptional regulator